MGDSSLLLSLCIPTNGMTEWVIPVVNSIYKQNVNDNLFEIIITDNGDNNNLYDKLKEIIAIHNNLIYKKTNSVLFQNQIDCFKLAKGNLVKFVNHRFVLLDGTLEKLINISLKYNSEKPIIFFINDCLKKVDNDEILNFNEFMNKLSYYSSWSGGISFWKDDAEKIFNKTEYNKYFPHLDVLFAFKDARKYILNNDLLFKELTWDVSKKGKYDFFYAFLVCFMDIINSLYTNKYISQKTYKKIRLENLFFCIGMHFEFVVRKLKCSYILNNFWEPFRKYYNIFDFIIGYSKIIIMLPIRVIRKIINILLNLIHHE